MDTATGNEGAKVRAVIATAFGCLDAASITWVANDGKGEIMDLYDECLAAVRGRPAAPTSPETVDGN
ncbi:hypothetical protein KUF83_38680 [Streptomyces sp. BV286]|nr:hypothetical protein [Streptomyces sp. BV286]MBV1942420.1 hypothetical protein [Streptomyces sp. BV286]